MCFRSRLADFFVNCQPEPRSLSGCLKENYADCLLAYSGLIGEFRFQEHKHARSLKTAQTHSLLLSWLEYYDSFDWHLASAADSEMASCLQVLQHYSSTRECLFSFVDVIVCISFPDGQPFLPAGQVKTVFQLVAK